MKVQCFCCGQELEYDEHCQCVYEGGTAQLDFSYGSKFDMWDVIAIRHKKDDRLKRLVNCDIIEAYICDKCFDKKKDRCAGFVVEQDRRRVTIENRREAEDIDN